MKILCLSDFVDPMIYNPEVTKLFPDVDFVLCAGDLSLDYVDYVVTVLNKPTYFIFGNHNLNDFHMYHKGARELPGAEADFGHISEGHGGIYAGFKVLREEAFPVPNPKNGKRTPLLIAGCTGSKKYNNGLAQYTERQMKFKLLMMAPKLLANKLRYGRYLDIFLTHAPPRHIHDHEDPCHQGFECYNWFIQKFTPAYLVHGHIHLYDMREPRVSRVNTTTIVNAYSHYTIEFPPPQKTAAASETSQNDN